jgi:hypothetical protein
MRWKKQISNGFCTVQLYISPIALAAGILSMNHDFVSFIPANFGSFVGLVFTFSVLGIFIHVVLQYQSWCWQIAMALAGQQRWSGKMLRRTKQEDVEQPFR